MYFKKCGRIDTARLLSIAGNIKTLFHINFGSSISVAHCTVPNNSWILHTYIGMKSHVVSVSENCYYDLRSQYWRKDIYVGLLLTPVQIPFQWSITRIESNVAPPKAHLPTKFVSVKRVEKMKSSSITSDGNRGGTLKRDCGKRRKIIVQSLSTFRFLINVFATWKGVDQGWTVLLFTHCDVIWVDEQIGRGFFRRLCNWDI